MYRFFDPPIHSITFSVDDLGLVPIYDNWFNNPDYWQSDKLKPMCNLLGGGNQLYGIKHNSKSSAVETVFHFSLFLVLVHFMPETLKVF